MLASFRVQSYSGLAPFWQATAQSNLADRTGDSFVGQSAVVWVKTKFWKLLLQPAVCTWQFNCLVAHQNVSLLATVDDCITYTENVPPPTHSHTHMHAHKLKHTLGFHCILISKLQFIKHVLVSKIVKCYISIWTVLCTVV